ncbi:hypothetical protein PCH_Pc15g01790 [Penicillium rubens Wisconsin 54-1255]|uniref:Uncharacterized protein n=1 Tax=Penicillium rubens (strain ATCC 28089 / DSM 1075 / NRRL 1951 / Wisconsin 54-1255) TaxID=500485 RepID=B6H6B4_PENRW|nr:hypothetical protein PCH_Pc15g01790 [Penicillium rubens Wisconsin 54-1255]
MSLNRGAFSCKGIPVYSFCHALRIEMTPDTKIAHSQNWGISAKAWKLMPTRQVIAGSRDLQRESGIGIRFFQCFGAKPSAVSVPLKGLCLEDDWLQPGIRLEFSG